MVGQWWMRARTRRARRALERQLGYQKKLAEREHAGSGAGPPPTDSKAVVADSLLSHVALAASAHVLEIGNGARGLIAHLPQGGLRVAVDPLALDYRVLFPAWSRHFQRCVALGERLPFRDESFDAVLCDNVIDHAEDPPAIVREAIRILKPNAAFYFSVHVHHPFYRCMSNLYGLLGAVGMRVEIGAFADHTVHLTAGEVRRMIGSLPLRVVAESDGVENARIASRASAGRLSDSLKRVFYKNARFVTIALKA